MPNPWDYARDTDEHSHQVALFMWVAAATYWGIDAASQHSFYDPKEPREQFKKEPVPELKLLYAIPNGGERNVIVATKLKAEGVRPGVSDLMLPVARHGYHGLYIEMKKPKGKASDEQKAFASLVGDQGYAVMLCDHWTKAAEVLAGYLRPIPWFNALPYFLLPERDH